MITGFDPVCTPPFEAGPPRALGRTETTQALPGPRPGPVPPMSPHTSPPSRALHTPSNPSVPR
ncbi:antitermination regulator, partial [Burkholderia cepacia]